MGGSTMVWTGQVNRNYRERLRRCVFKRMSVRPIRTPRGNLTLGRGTIKDFNAFPPVTEIEENGLSPSLTLSPIHFLKNRDSPRVGTVSALTLSPNLTPRSKSFLRKSERSKTVECLVSPRRVASQDSQVSSSHRSLVSL